MKNTAQRFIYSFLNVFLATLHVCFESLTDVTVVNAWLLYKKTTAQNGGQDSSGRKIMRLHEFKLSVASALCCSGLNNRSEKKSGRPVETVHSAKRRKICPRVANDVRTDGVQHWPKWCTSRGRCKRKGCKGTSRVTCSKCKVASGLMRRRFIVASLIVRTVLNYTTVSDKFV